jgi:hypothetical protein
MQVIQVTFPIRAVLEQSNTLNYEGGMNHEDG